MVLIVVTNATLESSELSTLPGGLLCLPDVFVDGSVSMEVMCEVVEAHLEIHKVFLM